MRTLMITSSPTGTSNRRFTFVSAFDVVRTITGTGTTGGGQRMPRLRILSLPSNENCSYQTRSHNKRIITRHQIQHCHPIAETTSTIQQLQIRSRQRIETTATITRLLANTIDGDNVHRDDRFDDIDLDADDSYDGTYDDLDDDGGDDDDDGRYDESDASTVPRRRQQAPMEHHANIYTQWSLDDDRLLWENYQRHKRPIVEIASLLGRGLNGVTSRLAKLRNVNSFAYQRLFVGETTQNDNPRAQKNVQDDGSSKAGQQKTKKKKGRKNYDDDEDDSNLVESRKTKLVPITEVLRRIEYDPTVHQSDFSIRYYDRVDDKILDANFDDPNTSIAGSATSFIKALPEHRIMSVYYKNRIVWDRDTKLDLVFGRSNAQASTVRNPTTLEDDDDGVTSSSASSGIAYVIETYPQWEEEQRRLVQLQEERKHHIEYVMTRMLGVELFGQFSMLVRKLGEVHKDPAVSTKQHIEQEFVPRALSIMIDIRDDPTKLQQHCMDPSLIPQSDWLALDMISEYVSATIDDADLRSQTLWEIFYQMDRIDGGKSKASSRFVDESVSGTTPSRDDTVQSIVLTEEELEETFVRGSGPGGQKVNKTSNRVVLVHIPTQIRVECQDTRSLQQNRKIARKRLALKLDEYLNGRQSKVQRQQIKESQKRQKVKSKNRARYRKKLLEKQQQEQSTDGQDHNDDDISF